MAHNPEGDAMSLMGERHVLSILAFLVERGRSTKSDIYANVSRGTRMPDKLEALEREGLIEMSRGDIKILDREKLRELTA